VILGTLAYLSTWTVDKVQVEGCEIVNTQSVSDAMKEEAPLDNTLLLYIKSKMNKLKDLSFVSKMDLELTDKNTVTVTVYEKSIAGCVLYKGDYVYFDKDGIVLDSSKRRVGTDMKHKVLILGTLGEFTELVKKAKEKGYETVVCDGYADGIARTYADKAYTIPVTDVDAIALMCREEGVDGIITSFSDLLLECMVKIADKAGLPCYLKPEQLSWYRDKSACRDVLDKLGLPAPGFRKISVELLKQGSEEEIQQSIANLQYPLISKPLDKYGSRGIFIIHHSDEVRKKALQTAEYTDCQEILVEEYNDGYEFNMMTWVMDGKVNVISIADREKTEMEEGMLPLSTRNVYPSRFLAEVEKSATDILQNYIRYTGQTEGALSMQFFWKPGRGIQVCEIAGRFFGYEHELTDMVYGFQTEELLLDYLYEKDRIKEMFHRHDIHHPVKYGAVLYFQGRQLQIADQTAACELAKEKCVVKPWIFYKEGERVIEYGPNPYLALYYI
jgi:carbamoylphosphate synthase large subunit